MSYEYDTFENEAELSTMIKKMQAESINHMKRYDAWEVPELDSFSGSRSMKKERVIVR